MNFFKLCREILTDREDRGPAEHGGGSRTPAEAGHGVGEDAARGALAFLVQLGYLSPGAPDTTRPAPAALERRGALLGLAERMERIFRLPCRQAMSAFFIGGEVAPERFGLAPPDQPVEGVGGKGLTLAAAFEGCLGEAAEYLSFLRWNDEPVFRCSAGSLFSEARVDRHASLPWMLAGLGLAPHAVDVPLDWVEARSLGAAASIPVPAALCYRAPPETEHRQLRKAESNGCAAAPDLSTALCRALLEVVERDAVALWWYGGREPRALALSPPDREALDGFMAVLRKDADRRHWFLDLTTDVGIPVVAALSADTAGAAVIAGLAADLDPLAAARHAALELCQMELGLDLVLLKIEQRGRDALNDADRKQLVRMDRLRADALPRLRPRPVEIVAQAALPTEPDRVLEICLERLRRAGFTAYWIDLSRPALPLAVARVLVPGLQSAKCDWITPRLRRTAEQHGMPPPTWGDLPSVI